MAWHLLGAKLLPEPIMIKTIVNVWQTTKPHCVKSMHAELICENGTMHLHFASLFTWWRHQMETFSTLLAICAGNSPVTGEFPSQWPVTRSFDVFVDLRLSKRLSKQSRGWWVEMPLHSLWRHCNEISYGVSCWNPPSREMKHARINIIKLMMAWVTTGSEAHVRTWKKNNWFIQKFSSCSNSWTVICEALIQMDLS